MMSNAVSYEPRRVVSEYVSYPNQQGQRIAAYIDTPSDIKFGENVVVMSPKYGETKKNNLKIAYYLAQNGFTVLRFDFTSHFGESEGEMLDFTLPAGVADTIASIDYVQRRFVTSRVTLLASSLSALMAYRVAEIDERVDHLVCLVGVVDFTHTMMQVYQEDLFGGYMSGRRFGVLDVLGHEVRMDEFLGSAISSEMHSLDGTLKRIKSANCAISMIPAENDTWVKLDDVYKVAAVAKRAKVYPIAGAMHEVNENQAAADRSIGLIVSICRVHSGLGDFNDEVIVPDKRTLLKQNRLERDRLRDARPASEDEEAFWGKYLGKYRVMEKMGDYQNYLDLVGRLLGPISEGDILLDAGCGNGLFGAWVLHEILIRRKSAFEVPPIYIGLDLTIPGLMDALAKHTELRKDALKANKNAEVSHAFVTMYAQMDLDEFGSRIQGEEDLVRFSSDCFDKIVCSLLLSYLTAPEDLLKKLYAKLRPGGKIVISSMKPYCDLSAIYRDFAEQKSSSGDLESARELLQAAGAIKVKQEQGYYAFFSSDELIQMLTRAGFVGAEAFASLGNQAWVAVATK